MKNKNIPLLSTLFVLFTASNTLMADQISDVSVFQPTKNVLANVSISQNQLILKTDQHNHSFLAEIKHDYITLYPNQLYMLNDHDNDGMIEVSALKSVNALSNEFCYSVYNYNINTQLYENKTALISCKKGNLDTMGEQRNIANADNIE